MRKSHLLIFIIIICAGFPHRGQGQDESIRVFATESYQQQLLLDHPEVASSQKAIENHVRQFLRSGIIEEDVSIPVVIHLLPGVTDGPANPAAIASQMNALNEHFNSEEIPILHPADTLEGFHDVAEVVRIRFCLAEVPGGPIRFVNTLPRAYPIGQEMKQDESGEWLTIDPERILNIWIAELEDPNIAGFAQMPGGPLETDGIVINRSLFGISPGQNSPFSKGKTLTHLVGNYLGLYDLARSARCADDYVTDTPVHNAPNRGCSTDYKHVSTCGDYPVEMSMNYMAASDDDCLYIFTSGQKRRIYAMLVGGGPRAMLGDGIITCDPDGDADSSPVDAIGKEFGRSDELKAIRLYPNPTSGRFTVEWSAKTSTAFDYVIYDAFGRIAERGSGASLSGTNRLTIEAADWPKGIYEAQLHIAERVYTTKLVLQ